MANIKNPVVGNGYVCYATGKRSHLCISDKKNFRYSLCGLAFRRTSPAWASVRWEALSHTSRVTCKKCIEILTGRKNWEEEL